MTERHLRDEEIQGVVDGEEVDRVLIDHLDRCPHCARALDRYRRAFSLLEELGAPEPPLSLETRIVERLFPRRERSIAAFFRLPGWARALAPALLLAGSAAFVLFARLAIVLGEIAVRWGLRADPGPVRLVAERISRGFPALFEGVGGLVQWIGAARAVGRAALLAGGTPQFVSAALASAGIVACLAVGWRARLLLSRAKGGHHALLL